MSTNKLIRVSFVVIIILAFSCKNSKSRLTSLTKADLQGYYEQQGEGQIIAINDSIVTSYYSGSFNCYPNWEISRAYFNKQTPNLNILDRETFTYKEGFTTYTYKKLSQKPRYCKELTEKQKNDYDYNFETLWNTFNDQYAFFKERTIDWKKVKEKYKAKYNDETRRFDFYTILKDMVLELQDTHSDFEVPDEFEKQWERLYLKSDTTDYENLVKDKIINKYVKQLKKYNGNELTWGLINDDIAYIQLNGMDALANYKTTDAAKYWEIAEKSDDYFTDVIKGTHYITKKIVTDIKDTKYCIIDLRFNGGGYDQVGLAFMSHFIKYEYDVFKKKRRFRNGFAGEQTIGLEPSKKPYLNPIYLLTSPYTASAAETTILATMNFPHFKRVGSNTNGALSDLLLKELPNGWLYALSNEVYETMDGIVYEVSGIPSNYNIDYPKDEEEFYKSMLEELKNKDRAIEKVIELSK